MGLITVISVILVFALAGLLVTLFIVRHELSNAMFPPYQEPVKDEEQPPYPFPRNRP
jgi:hypothetical protein